MNKKVILIGGSSHAGKSTLARALAEKLGGETLSTDSMARHPGRPWNHATGVVKDHVIRHYATLSAEELLADVLDHYRRNVLPQVAAIIAARVSDSSAVPLVLEGSALWPEMIARMDLTAVAPIWLTLPEELFEKRLKTESRYVGATDEGKQLIDAFLARTLLYNRRMNEVIERHGLLSFEVGESMTPAFLTERCLNLVRS